jgi:hypothetical protein
MSEVVYVVEMDVIGFVGPVNIKVHIDPSYEKEITEEEVIRTAMDHLTETKGNDASVIKVSKSGGKEGGKDG